MDNPNKRIHIQLMHRCINEAKNAFNSGKYDAAIGHFDGVKIYATEAGVEIPEEAKTLGNAIYTKGMKEKIKEAKKRKINGWYSHAAEELKEAKIYATEAGVKIPEEAKTLEKKIYKNLIEEEIKWTKEAIKNEDYPYAKRCIASAKSYAEEAGVKIPEEAKTLESELEKLLKK